MRGQRAKGLPQMINVQKLKWSSNSLMKPHEPKSQVINIDWGLERSEDIFGLVVSTFDLGTGGLCK